MFYKVYALFTHIRICTLFVNQQLFILVHLYWIVFNC